MKRVRKTIKRGVTVEGGFGPGFIVKSGAKFVSEKGWTNRFYIKLAGMVFTGRVYVLSEGTVPNKGESYRLRFKKKYGKSFATVKHLSGVRPSQLTAVLDAYVNGTGVVEQTKEVA
jgi:hypothetical protein